MDSGRSARLSLLVTVVGVLYLGVQLVALYGLEGGVGLVLALTVVGLALVARS